MGHFPCAYLFLWILHSPFPAIALPPLPRSVTRPLARSLLTVYCYCDSAPDEMWAKNMSLLNTGLSEVVCISLLTRRSIYDSHPNLLHFIYWSFCTFNGKWILNWFWLVSLPCRILIWLILSLFQTAPSTTAHESNLLNFIVKLNKGI